MVESKSVVAYTVDIVTIRNRNCLTGKIKRTKCVSDIGPRPGTGTVDLNQVIVVFFQGWVYLVSVALQITPEQPLALIKIFFRRHSTLPLFVYYV